MGRPETARLERRDGPRKRVRFKIRFWNDDIDASGFTTDLSEQGVFVETRKPAPPGTRLHLEVDTPDGPVMAECIVARVVRVSATVASVAHSGMGVRIIPLREALGFIARPETALGDISVDLTEQARLEAFIAGELKTGGLFVETDAVPEMGCEVPLILQLPEPFVAMEATATVVHLSHNPKGVGLHVVAAKTLRERLQAIAAPARADRDRADHLVRIDEEIAIGSEIRLEVVSRGRRVEVDCVVKKLNPINEGAPAAARAAEGALPPATLAPSEAPPLSEPPGPSALAPPPSPPSAGPGPSVLTPPPPPPSVPEPAGWYDVPPRSGAASQPAADPNAIPLPSSPAGPTLDPELAAATPEALVDASDAGHTGPLEPLRGQRPPLSSAGDSKTHGAPTRVDAEPRRCGDTVTVEVDAKDPDAFRRLYENDIVRGGLFIPTTMHADLQTQVIIHLTLPEPFESMELEGHVVHQSPEPPGFGVQLTNLDDARSKIEPILKRLIGV